MTRNIKKTSDYASFEGVLKKVLSVPKDEMKRREEEYQRERTQKKKKRAKTSPASRASSDKD
jgi:hypothetical protein